MPRHDARIDTRWIGIAEDMTINGVVGTAYVEPSVLSVDPAARIAHSPSAYPPKPRFGILTTSLIVGGAILLLLYAFLGPRQDPAVTPSAQVSPLPPTPQPVDVPAPPPPVAEPLAAAPPRVEPKTVDTVDTLLRSADQKPADAPRKKRRALAHSGNSAGEQREDTASGAPSADAGPSSEIGLEHYRELMRGL